MINWLILHHVSSDICLILKDLCINITYSPIQPLNIIYNFNNFSVYNGIFILHTAYCPALLFMFMHFMVLYSNYNSNNCNCHSWTYSLILISVDSSPHMNDTMMKCPAPDMGWLLLAVSPVTALVPASASFCPATIRLQLQWNALRVELELETKEAEDYAKAPTKASPGWKHWLALPHLRHWILTSY